MVANGAKPIGIEAIPSSAVVHRIPSSKSSVFSPLTASRETFHRSPVARLASWSSNCSSVRISDEHDVVMYRDMLQIISDRIKDMVAKKMTLEQVKAAKPTLDYDGRYGSDTGPWTTAMFIEAVYRDVSKSGAGASTR